MNREYREKQLLVLAGPSGAGKSTLIKKIRSKQLPLSMYKQLQIEDISTLPIFEQKDIEQTMFHQFDFDSSMILHYDLFCNYFNRDNHESVLRIAEQFDRVTIITLCVPAKTLLNRIQLRIIQTLIKICLQPSYFKAGFTYFSNQWDKYQKYFRSNITRQIYREWFDFATATWTSSHWVLDSNQSQLEMQPVEVLKVQQLNL